MSFRRYFMRGLYVLAVIAVAWHIHALGWLGARFEPDDATDRAVVFTALEHFAQQDESSRKRTRHAGTIYLTPEARPYEADGSFEWWRAWPHTWHLENVATLRNSELREHGWSSSGQVRIRSWPEYQLTPEQEPPDFRCRVMTCRPGYSRNGQTAMVAMHFATGPNSHGPGVVIYLLTRSGERWAVTTFYSWYYA